MRSNKRQRDLARIEAMQRHTQERLEKQQQRINKRFERMRERLGDDPSEPNSNQQRIIDAALNLLNQEGLTNLSLRKLAGMLEMQAPALYWYFKNKEVLIDYMAEAILQKEFKDLRPRQADESWQDWLEKHMIQLRKAMLAYQDGGRVVAGAHIYPAVTLAKSFDTSVESMLSAGLDIQTARHIMMTTTHYTFGYVIEEQAAPTPEELAEVDINELLAPYPSMRKAFGEINFDDKDRADHDFVTGLRYIIKGGTA